MAPGTLGVALLAWAGIPREYNYLRVSRPSTIGLALYAAMLGFYLFTVAPTGVYTGWKSMEALVYSPASGVSQELFFRVTLLPALSWVLDGRFWLALLAHAVLFGLWHLGVLLTGATPLEAFPVILVPLVSCGAGRWPGTGLCFGLQFIT